MSSGSNSNDILQNHNIGNLLLFSSTNKADKKKQQDKGGLRYSVSNVSDYRLLPVIQVRAICSRKTPGTDYQSPLNMKHSLRLDL